jgi:hypothetical protein
MGKNLQVRSFVFKLFLFLIPITVFFSMAEFYLRSLKNSYRLKNERISKVNGDREVLILGSSQAFYNIDPEAFDRPAFNMGNTSQSLDLDSRLFEKYLPFLPKLKTVLLPISYFSAGYLLSDSIEKWRLLFYRSEYHFSNPSDIESPDLFLYLQAYGFSNLIKFIFSPEASHLTRGITDLGFFCTTGYVKPDEKLARKRVNFHSGLFKESNTARIRSAISRLIALALENHIEVKLISTPLYSQYRDQLDLRILTSQQELIQTYLQNSNVKFYDYSKDSRFSDQDFVDFDHLNCEGAKKFSRILNQEMRESRR